MKNLKIFIFITFYIILFTNLISKIQESQPVLHQIPRTNSNTGDFRPPLDPPPGTEIVAPAEFGRVDGPIISDAGWNQDLFIEIVRETAEVDTAFVLVRDFAQELTAETFLAINGVNLANVRYIYYSQISNSSMWIRDSGPVHVYEDGQRAIIDFEYSLIYSTDNEIPVAVADHFDFPYYCPGIEFQGGSFFTDGNGMGFITDIIYWQNPSFSQSEIHNIFKDYMGIDSLVVITPIQNDGTGHIDMFCKMLNDTLIMVGEYERPEFGYGDNFYIMNENAEFLDGLITLDGRDIEVVRIPFPPYSPTGGAAGHFTRSYTNSLIVNKKVYVPIYNIPEDNVALRVYQEAMPDHEIIGMDAEFIIEYWGAIHCITKLQYSKNPLFVLHDPISEIVASNQTQISFRVNPKFENTTAQVWYKLADESDYQSIDALLSNGIWTADLPAMEDDFEYFITAETNSGDVYFDCSLPELEGDCFDVNVEITSLNDNISSYVNDVTCYPNPFSPGVKNRNQNESVFSFCLEKPGKVEISVFNIKGQKVKQLKKDYLAEGKHQIKWDGKNSSDMNCDSGMFFYKLSTDYKEIVKKFVLIR